ncbi:DUF397 domain-containing protein [Kineosporia mesophila]|nr:DUF397 domain-containing protein [Kineosporia mesophila]MCD5352763.1 DUF397 domain-containing protein [Kineosporia mesophila]
MMDTPWVKATASDANGNCVEMRRHRGAIEIRDTKDRGEGPTLTLAPRAIASWLEGARRGEFTHLANR